MHINTYTHLQNIIKTHTYIFIFNIFCIVYIAYTTHCNVIKVDRIRVYLVHTYFFVNSIFIIIKVIFIYIYKYSYKYRINVYYLPMGIIIPVFYYVNI